MDLLLLFLGIGVVCLVLLGLVEAGDELGASTDRLGLVKRGHLGDPSLGNELKEGVGGKDGGSAHDGDCELTASDAGGKEKDRADLEEVEAGKNLDTDNNGQDDPGVQVGVEVRESVHLLGAHIAAVDQVENLEPDEGVEDQGEVLSLGCGLAGHVGLQVVNIEEVLSGPHDDAHDKELEETKAEDLTVHDTSHDVAFTGAVGGNVSLGAGGSEGKSTEDVHDEVDPDELSGVEARLSHGDLRHEDDNDDSEVAGKLELQETLDVQVNVAAPHNGSHA